MPLFYDISVHLTANADGCQTNQPVILWLRLILLVEVQQRCIHAIGGITGMHFVTWVCSITDTMACRVFLASVCFWQEKL